MTATFKFQLPEEDYEHQCALHGVAYKGLIHAVDDEMRNKLKYGHTFQTPDEAMEHVRTFIRERMDEIMEVTI